MNAPPPELFSTAEVMAHTGLSRQTLHTYKRIGLVTVAKRSASGRCYYAADVFERLRRVKRLQRHRSLADVRRLLDAQDALGHAEDSKIRTRAADDVRDAARVPDAPPRTSRRRSDSTRRAARRASPGSPPEKLYRIGEVMEQSGLSRQTIHNYTVQGLIHEARRTRAGHRLYDAAVFARLAKIERLKRHRSLDEVQALLERSEPLDTDTARPTDPVSPEVPDAR